MQLLRLHGTAAPLHRDPGAHELQNSGANLIPWRGRLDTMIDKHDCRSALDFIAEPGRAPEPKEEDMEMEVLLNFERYRGILESQRLRCEGATRLQPRF
jgi:hypothetical protein